MEDTWYDDTVVVVKQMKKRKREPRLSCGSLFFYIRYTFMRYEVIDHEIAPIPSKIAFVMNKISTKQIRIANTFFIFFLTKRYVSVVRISATKNTHLTIVI